MCRWRCLDSNRQLRCIRTSCFRCSLCTGPCPSLKKYEPHTPLWNIRWRYFLSSEKYSGFICLWGRRARNDHWVKKGWPPTGSMRIGEAYIINEPFVAREKIIIPPLYIKLGLMSCLWKSFRQLGIASCVCREFPDSTISQLKAGIFDGASIRKLINDSCSVQSMTETQSAAWQSFVLVTQNFLGNRKAENYQRVCGKYAFQVQEFGCEDEYQDSLLQPIRSFSC